MRHITDAELEYYMILADEIVEDSDYPEIEVFEEYQELSMELALHEAIKLEFR